MGILPFFVVPILFTVMNCLVRMVAIFFSDPIRLARMVKQMESYEKARQLIPPTLAFLRLGGGMRVLGGRFVGSD